MSNPSVNPPRFEELVAAGRDTDDLSRAPPSIDVIHSRIHRGHCFSYSAVVPLASQADYYFLGRCGAENIHLNSYAMSATRGIVLVTFYEAPTVTNVGTPVTFLNRHRGPDRQIVPSFSLYTAPTISNEGLFLETVPLLNTGGSTQPTGVSELPHEWVFSKNTDYLVKIDSQVGVGITFYGSFIWYEQIIED
jgi:hypothetical protein